MDELEFLSILNLIFTACLACKIQLRNKQKIKFIQLDLKKIKCRSVGGLGSLHEIFIYSFINQWLKKCPALFLSASVQAKKIQMFWFLNMRVKKRYKNVHFCNFFAYIIQFAASMTLVKFRFSEKATKIWPSRLQGFDVTISNVKTLGMIRPNFCGLLRISELNNYRIIRLAWRNNEVNKRYNTALEAWIARRVSSPINDFFNKWR